MKTNALMKSKILFKYKMILTNDRHFDRLFVLNNDFCVKFTANDGNKSWTQLIASGQ